MVLLYKHKQEKILKNKGLASNCHLSLSSDQSFLEYNSEFYTEFMRLGKKNSVTFFHSLLINKKSGDISVTYTINTEKSKNYRLYKSGHWIKKNNFQYLKELIDRGFYQGEKKEKFWGIKYYNATTDIYLLIEKELKSTMNNSFIVEKNHRAKSSVSPLYDLVVDFHLNKKKIKQHDEIYTDILHEYPKQKWLKKNDNKFIPAVLDSYGIKSGYLIKNLSTRVVNRPVIIKSLNFICKLFGENYVDYLNKIDWIDLCSEKVNIKKYYTCKNDAEKISLIQTLKNWDDTNITLDGKLKSIYEAFSIREKIEEIGIDLKFKSKNTNEFANLVEKWKSHFRYIKVGYKLKYAIPSTVINEIEQPIEYNNKIYHPRVVNTEDQFRIEGHLMKNCMATQFNMGLYYLYISLSCGKKRVNTQYRKGVLAQARGRANTDLPEEFKIPVQILSERLLKYRDLTWHKEKYDFINK